MTAALNHSLPWERTPPGVTVAIFVVATGLAVTGALQFPAAQRAEPAPPALRVTAPVAPPPTPAPSIASPTPAPPTTAEPAAPTPSASPDAASPGAPVVAAVDGGGASATVAEAPATAHAFVASADAAPSGPIDPRCPPRWSIRFRRGSWSTPPRLAVHFVSLREYLARNPRANVLVLGYADPLGTDRDNHALSVRRAAAVAVSIRRAGVPATKVTVGGVGAFTAEVEGAEDSDALRRVEVRVRGVAPCAGVSEEVVDP